MRKFWFIVLFLFFISILFAIPLAQYQIPYFNIKEKKSYDFFVQGVTSFNNSNYKISQNFFLKSLNLKPDFYFARKFLAESYLLSGDIESALEEYEILKNQFPYDEYINYKIVQLQNLLYVFNNVSFQSESNLVEFALWKEIDGSILNETSFIPIDITKDNEHIYCLMYEPKGILVFDLQGNLKKVRKDFFLFSMKNPSKLFLANDFLLISDFFNDKIFAIDKNLNRIIKTIEIVPYPTYITNLEDQFYIWSNKDQLFYKFDKNLNFIDKIQIQYRNDLDTKKINLNTPIFSKHMNNIYMIAGDKLYKIDSSGFILEEADIPYKNIKNLFIENEHIYISDSNKIWFKKNSQKDWNLIENFYNVDITTVDQIKNIQFREISSIYKDNHYFLITDVSGKIYIFIEKHNANNNMNLQITNIEAHSYPQIAVLLKVNDLKYNPVDNLNQNNFEVYENNQRVFLINSTNFNKYKDKINLLILKDINFTIDDTYKKLFKNKIYELIEEFDINDNVDFALAGENIKIVYNGKYNVEIFNLIETPHYFHTDRNIILNLFQSMNHLTSLKGKKSILLLTNSEERFNVNEEFKQLIYYSKIHSIPIYVISFKKNQDLMNIAIKTGGNYFNFFDNYNFVSIYKAINAQPTNSYLITYKALTPYHKKTSNKFIHVKVKINYFEYGGLGESGYIIP